MIVIFTFMIGHVWTAAGLCICADMGERINIKEDCRAYRRLLNIGTAHMAYFPHVTSSARLVGPETSTQCVFFIGGNLMRFGSPPSSSSLSILRSITGLLLKSFPDNRCCFHGLTLGSDPGAEQRALEERSVDLHREGAATSTHERNS